MRGEEIVYSGRDGQGVESPYHFVNVMGYPDGSPMIPGPAPERVDRVLFRPRSMAALLGGVSWLETVIMRAKGLAPDVILPFVPGARQDRMNGGGGDQLFFARTVASLINGLALPRVTVFDPHSDVISALLDNCLVIHPAEAIGEREEMKKYTAVVSPDGGAEKRSGAVARKFGLPLMHGWKVRDTSTGALSAFGIEPFGKPGDHVMVVDDICDGGGTFIGLAAKLKERGITADLWVSHGLFTKGTRVLLDHFVRVYCTDSLALDRPGTYVNDVCWRLFAKGTP